MLPFCPRDYRRRQRAQSPESNFIDHIEKIVCFVPEVAVPIICEPLAAKRKPGNSYGAKFSLPIIVSLAITEPDIKLDTFAPVNISPERILKLAQKVEYEIDPHLPFPKYFPGKVRMIFKNGRMLEERREINRGHPDWPLSEKEIQDKFLVNAKKVFANEEHPQSILAKVGSLEDLPVKELAEILRGG